MLTDPTNELGTNELRKAQGYVKLKADCEVMAEKLAIFDELVAALEDRIHFMKAVTDVDSPYSSDVVLRARAIGK